MTFKEVEITSRGAKQIQAGSLWIFANEFVTKMKTLVPGEWVNFKSRGDFVGFGYVNPHSLISGRVCSLSPENDRKACLDKNLKEALAKRLSLKTVGSFRCVFSESDNIPGLIVDVYGDIVVAQFNTKGIDEAKIEIVDTLKKYLDPTALVIRGDSSIRILEGALEFNELVFGDKNLITQGKVREDDVFFAADFLGGQKTGFFIDQRDNRRDLKKRCEGKNVLDLCSYSGGWGLTALKGGASHVTFVDQSKEALDLARRGMGLNNFEEKAAAFIKGDVFDFLEGNKEEFDVVICDPPAFVKSKKNLSQAIRAYKKLNTLAAKRVRPGGLLYSCSCSFHLSEGEFEKILTEVFQDSGRSAEVIYRGGQPSDHPWVLNRPESRYLKCYCLRL